jgi:hypothetical protein
MCRPRLDTGSGPCCLASASVSAWQYREPKRLTPARYARRGSFLKLPRTNAGFWPVGGRVITSADGAEDRIRLSAGFLKASTSLQRHAARLPAGATLDDIALMALGGN